MGQEKEALRQTRDALEEAQAALNGAPNTQGLHSQIDAALRASHFALTSNTAPGSAGQNGAHTAYLVETLSYTISCLVSLRKNYEERELGLWDDVSKAITQGKSAIAAATGEAV